MNIIIAGGRDFNDYYLLKKSVNKIINSLYENGVEITIVSGCAKGADKLGEQYANEYNFNIKRFPADWNKYGKSAGPIRNKQMAKNSEVLIAFWNGESKGTLNMIKNAKENHLTTFVFRY